MVDVVLVTGRKMPHGPEAETPLLVAALRSRGVEATIEPWGSEASSQARLVVIRTTWDYTGDRDRFLDWAREVAAQTRLLNPIEIIEWNSHKSYLLDLAYAGVPVIPTTMVARGASDVDQQSALEEYTGQVVIKPAVSVGAIGTARELAGSKEALSHLASLVAEGDALVQPFVPGVTDGEVSLIYFGGELSHAVRKVPADGDYRVQTFLGGTVHPHVATEVERGVAASALLAVPSTVAYARVDLVSTAQGPVVMEIELIEPQLFLDEDAGAPVRFANHLLTLLSDGEVV
jgi:glutathione synthase/RimK-type ligase-like ATP-grasp enzyme